MPLASGTKLGPYELVGTLGAGGMGEVYRAKDTRLDRIVAIKILPAEVSANAERKQRFEREARTISSLNHPNICALYDVGSQDGIEYLVLEFVEGETLEKRLEKGSLATDVLLRHGIEIADALEKAHCSGVIHRDLKPSNIMLTKAGAKLLDFGLAKWSAGNLSEEETLRTLTTAGARLTEEGSVVGTFQYMSPELLEGKEADERTDLFAFGEVLYEMATGRPAFAGKTKASLIAAILSSEPAPLSALQPMTPPTLERLVRGCLEKHPDERWQTAHDVKLQLRAIAEVGSQSGVAIPIAAARKNRERLLAGVALVALGAAIVLGVLYRKRTPEKPRVVRSYIRAMPNTNFVFMASPAAGFAISPDGLHLAYVAVNSEHKKMLWVRPMDSLQAQPLAGTQDASYPFWSPDSRWIGFFAAGKLKKIEAAGGPPLTLCDAPNPRGGAWNQEGTILFDPNLNQPLHRVPAAGGTATPVTNLNFARGEISHRWPQFLPDGRHFLYLTFGPSINEIMVGSLDSKESKSLVRADGSAMYAAGNLLFLRQNTLMAQPFDAKRLELTGDAAPIADPVQREEVTRRSVFSVSQNGILTYLEGAGNANRQLIWVDRSGKKVGEVPGLDAYRNPRLSPDGKKILYSIETPEFDVWSYDTVRGVKTRLTFGSNSGSPSFDAIWSPDGQRIAYTSVRGGKFGFYEKAANGSGNEQLLQEVTAIVQRLNDWSPDGKFLAYQHNFQGGLAISVLPLNDSRESRSVLKSDYAMVRAAFSPDGRWLAYCSNETGDMKIYVVPFPGPGGKWQVSSGGGDFPRWRHDGKEIFYLSLDNKLMAAEVKASGSSFSSGTVRELFEARFYSGTISSYDVSADGQRFIIPYLAEQPDTMITVVEHWDAELKKK